MTSNRSQGTDQLLLCPINRTGSPQGFSQIQILHKLHKKSIQLHVHKHNMYTKSLKCAMAMSEIVFAFYISTNIPLNSWHSSVDRTGLGLV